MYPNRFGAASPPINNPFVTDPTNAQARYPDISSTVSSHGYSPTPSQFSPWAGQANAGAAAYNYAPASNGAHPNPFQTSAFLQQQQAQPQFQQQQFVTATATGLPFQPSSAFGQQMAGQLSGTGLGYLTGQQPQQTAYLPAQQQLQSPAYANVASLDPYASIGQGWDGLNGTTQQQPQQYQQAAPSPTSSSFGVGQQQLHQPQNVTTSKSLTGELHPREYVRAHKAEVESWDTYAWKQLLSAFDSLKHAWERRKTELKALADQTKSQELQYAAAGYFTAQFQQEAARLQGLMKDAETNYDSIAASTFQMKEVFQGYRQSADLASKRRVREATNAALQSLPDWPSSTY